MNAVVREVLRKKVSDHRLAQIRAQQDRQNVARCAGCDATLDSNTIGCDTCWERDYRRGKRKKK